MRPALYGLLLCPLGVLAGDRLIRPAHTAFAHPVTERAAAKVSRALAGHFYAGATLTDDGEIPAIERRACPVSAPSLGERALYVEETFGTDLSHPFSQRLVVIDTVSASSARVREFTFHDPASMKGFCQRSVHPPIERSAVNERLGCALTASVHGSRLEARTEGERCTSMLNGAHHASRTVVAHRSYLRVHDQGIDDHGRTVWGNSVSPRQYVKISANATD